MAMTLRLEPADEELLRALADREKRTMTDVVAMAIRARAASLDAADEDASLALRAERRAAWRRSIDESMERNADLLERLSR